ncbi:Gag polyprotein [Bienertia sinuspersici]
MLYYLEKLKKMKSYQAYNCTAYLYGVVIRVLLDVHRPLTQKYERLPVFCYWCGKIGHASRECDDNKEEESAEYTYGSWLKASPWKPMKDGRHKKEDEEGKGCERQLFVTKPRQEGNKAAGEQVDDMISKLTWVTIQEARDEEEKDKKEENREG